MIPEFLNFFLRYSLKLLTSNLASSEALSVKEGFTVFQISLLSVIDLLLRLL